MADRNRLISIVLGMLVVSCAHLVLTQAASVAAVIGAGVAAGLGMAIAQPALQALAIDLAPPQRRGSGMATFTATADVGILIGTSAAGVLVAHISFSGAFAVAAAGPLVGLLVLLTLEGRRVH